MKSSCCQSLIKTGEIKPETLPIALPANSFIAVDLNQDVVPPSENTITDVAKTPHPRAMFSWVMLA